MLRFRLSRFVVFSDLSYSKHRIDCGASRTLGHSFEAVKDLLCSSVALSGF